MKTRLSWLAYALMGVLCAAYLNLRSEIVPSWGKWYIASRPHVLLQARAFLAGRLAIFPHSIGSGHDYCWGRGGMHQMRGLGVAILATPLHVLARLFGAIGFPDNLRFLLFYFVTSALLARAFHLCSRREPGSLAGSCLTAAFVMLFPTFVGMISARFLIFEHTIAVGALWSILLLSLLLTLVASTTERALLVVCALAGFAPVIRQPLALYGVSTVLCALAVAWRKGLTRRALVLGLGAYAAVMAAHFLLVTLRFGDPFVTGYETSLSGPYVNRSVRWGLSFARVPVWHALKEQFVTLFLLSPVAKPLVNVIPDVLRPYAEGDRWREYYSPTFDLFVLGAVLLALASLVWQTARHKPWRSDWRVEQHLGFVLGAWALLPGFALFYFYARFDSLVTRYAVDLYPAFVALILCAAWQLAEFVRERVPRAQAAARLLAASVGGVYVATVPAWPLHLSPPIDAALVQTAIDDVDSSTRRAEGVLQHFACGGPRGTQPVYTQLAEWQADCSFKSGMVVAMPHSACVSFTLAPSGSDWSEADRAALAHFRANGDFDQLVSCGAPRAEGQNRVVTLCEPRAPRFLLDGLRLYTVASLDDGLKPLDSLKLMRIDAASSCQK